MGEKFWSAILIACVVALINVAVFAVVQGIEFSNHLETQWMIDEPTFR